MTASDKYRNLCPNQKRKYHENYLKRNSLLMMSWQVLVSQKFFRIKLCKFIQISSKYPTEDGILEIFTIKTL